MRLNRLLPGALGVALALSAGLAAGRAVAADEATTLPMVVLHYLPIRAALAADDLGAVKEHADVLAAAKDRKFAAAARELAGAEDIAGARKAFGTVSKLLIEAVEGNEKAKDAAVLPTLHEFECPMAKPYGKWLQEERDIANPYMGAKMPRCGSRVDLLGGGGEPARLLDEYESIRAALAGDSIEGVKTAAEILAFSHDRSLAAAARAVGEADDIATVRKAFGDLSSALIAEVETHEKKKGHAALPALHLFECPMAKPYGKWLQTDPDIANPYMGSRMPRCGEEKGTFGGEGDASAATYVCPMHPDVTATEPGKCPKCGMALHKK